MIAKKNGIEYEFVKIANKESKEKSTLVFVHGASCNKQSFKYLVKEIKNYDCYVIDLPGHGGSDDTGYTFNNYIEKVSDFISDLNDVILIGHSLGGVIVLSLLSQNLKNVNGGFIISSGAKINDYDPDAAEFIKKVYDGVMDSTFLARAAGSLDNEDLLATLPTMEGTDIAITDFKLVDTVDVSSHISDISVPVYAVTGSEDPVTPPKYTQYLKEHVKNCTTQVFPGFGHFMFIANKKKVAELIENFAKSTNCPNR